GADQRRATALRSRRTHHRGGRSARPLVRQRRGLLPGAGRGRPLLRAQAPSRAGRLGAHVLHALWVAGDEHPDAGASRPALVLRGAPPLALPSRFARPRASRAEAPFAGGLRVAEPAVTECPLLCRGSGRGGRWLFGPSPPADPSGTGGPPCERPF